MTGKKVYVIRRKNFMYGDDYYYFSADAPEFNFLSFDQKKVEIVKSHLERLMYKMGGPNGLALSEYIEGNDDSIWSDKDAIQKLKQLFKDYFNIDIELNEFGFFVDKKSIRIPSKATHTQVNEIRKLLQLDFFSIYEMDADDEGMSYEINYKSDFFPKKFKGFDGEERDYYDNLNFKGSFLTEENAIEQAVQNFYEFYAEWDYTAIRGQQHLPGFKGSYKELSKSPAILESALLDMKQFSYDEANEMIIIIPRPVRLDYELFPQEFKTINSLLHVKPIEIIKKPIQTESFNDEEFDALGIALKIVNSIRIRNIPM